MLRGAQVEMRLAEHGMQHLPVDHVGPVVPGEVHQSGLESFTRDVDVAAILKAEPR